MREKLLDLMKNEGLKPQPACRAGQRSIPPEYPTFSQDATNRASICCKRSSGGFPGSIRIGCCSIPTKCIGMNIRQPRRASRPPVYGRQRSSPELGNDLFTPTLPGGLRADEKQTQDADGHDGSATQFPPALFGKANIKRVVVLYDDQTFESFTPSTKR